MQGELEEEDRLVRQREEEVNIVSWDNVVYTFVDMDTILVKGSEVRAEGSETRVEGSSKRAGEELEQESSTKQKLEEDKESEELKKCLEIFLDDGDDVTIDATPLSIKSPSIVDWKIHKEGKKLLPDNQG
ncbi:hypothetical protein Tco_1276390 [Tanacetum coccineum]